MTALFLVVFLEQWKSTKDHASAVLGVFVSFGLLDFVWAGRISDPVADHDSRPFDGGKTVSREGGSKRWFRIHEIGTVAMAAAVTMALRFLPFFVFRGDRPMPEGLRYLAGVLPCAMIGMLVIYCLRNTDVFAAPHGLPEIVSCLLVAVLHLWKRNTLHQHCGWDRFLYVPGPGGFFDVNLSSFLIYYGKRGFYFLGGSHEDLSGRRSLWEIVIRVPAGTAGILNRI